MKRGALFLLIMLAGCDQSSDDAAAEARRADEAYRLCREKAGPLQVGYHCLAPK